MDTLLERLTLLLEQYDRPIVQLEYIAKELEENDIDYCIVGGIALGIHNYKRYTQDIDILVSKIGYNKIMDIFIGNGWSFRPGSKKNLYYHTGSGCRILIDLLVEGDLNNGFIMPSPIKIRKKMNEIWYVSLPNLINLKLISNRSQDINDIIRLILANNLNSSFSSKLYDSVKDKFITIFNTMEDKI